VSVSIGAGGCKRGTAMSVGSIRVVSRREIGVMYCLLSRPAHARSGVRLEIGCHLPGVRERAVYLVYDPVLFQGSYEDCGVLPVISLIDLGSSCEASMLPFLHLSCLRLHLLGTLCD
jgi:hypothetical protein